MTDEPNGWGAGDHYPDAEPFPDEDEAIDVQDEPSRGGTPMMDPDPVEDAPAPDLSEYGPSWDEHNQALGRMESKLGEYRTRLAQSEAQVKALENELGTANYYELRGRRAADFLLNFVENASLAASNQAANDASGPGVIGSAAVDG